MTTRYCPDWLLASASAEPTQAACVDVSNGRISYVGPIEAAPPAPSESAEPVDLVAVSGMLIPGLVNVHCHTPMVLLRGAGEGLPLQRWLQEVMWPREAKLTPEDVYWGMTLGASELLRNGVTTSCEMYFHGEAMAEAARAVGLRSMIAPPLIEAGFDDLGTIDEQIAAVHDLAAATRGDDLISVAFGPHSVYALSKPVLEQVGEAARDAHINVHLHVAELADENEICQAKHGQAVVPFLDSIGMLDTHLMAAHGVWLDDADRATLAAATVGIAHCPTSNMRHANGIAPVTAHRAAGIAVGIGTDGAASASTLDMFAEMRTALGLARVSTLDPNALGTVDVLTMATSEGARVLGLGDIGSLAPGNHADMVSIDVGASAFNPVLEPADLVTHLVWSATPAEVDKVWVAGSMVVDDGQVLSADTDQAAEQVNIRARRIAQ